MTNTYSMKNFSLRRFIVILLCLCSFLPVTAQSDWPFYASIQEFKKQDSISFPKEDGILFIGSSSIRRWTDLKERFHEYPIIQRGFGGCEYNDILHYADDIIFPYRPNKIVLYAGENDLVKGKSVEQIYDIVLTLYHRIREELPNATVYLISVKPSGKLKEYQKAIVTFNTKIQQYIDAHPVHFRYIDIYPLMVDEQGEPIPALYVADQLHLTAKGYDIWEAAIREVL